jgi:hypothetical protein
VLLKVNAGACAADSGDKGIVNRRGHLLHKQAAGENRIESGAVNGFEARVDAGFCVEQARFVEPWREALDGNVHVVFQGQRNRILQAQQ